MYQWGLLEILLVSYIFNDANYSFTITFHAAGTDPVKMMIKSFKWKAALLWK